MLAKFSHAAAGQMRRGPAWTHGTARGDGPTRPERQETSGLFCLYAELCDLHSIGGCQSVILAPRIQFQVSFHSRV